MRCGSDSLESSIRLYFPHSLPHVLITTGTSNLLESKLSLDPRNSVKLGTRRPKIHVTYAAVLILDKVYEGEASFAEHFHYFD